MTAYRALLQSGWIAPDTPVKAALGKFGHQQPAVIDRARHRRPALRRP